MDRRGVNAMLQSQQSYPDQTHSLAFPSHNPPNILDYILLSGGSGALAGGLTGGPVGAGIGLAGGVLGGAGAHTKLYGPGSESHNATQSYNNEYGPDNQPPAYVDPETGPVFHPQPSWFRGGY